MDEFKVCFPTGYLDTNIENDNIDVNIVFKNGDVYFGVLATVENIKESFNRGDLYYWSTDLIIVKNLNKSTIKNIVIKTVLDKNFKHIFCKIGSIKEVYGDLTYAKIEDMNDYIQSYYKK